MSPVEKYIHLIKQFISEEITASQFEKSYLQMFKVESETLPEDIYTILNNLFIDIDFYCSDESLRDKNDIGGQELLEKAKKSLAQLSANT